MKGKGFICGKYVVLVLQRCSKEEVPRLTLKDLENILPDTVRVVGYLPYYRFAVVNTFLFVKSHTLTYICSSSMGAGNLLLPSTTPSVSL